MFQYANCLSVSLFSLNNKHRIAYHIQYGISTLRVTPSTAERKITSETVSNYRDGASFHLDVCFKYHRGQVQPVILFVGTWLTRSYNTAEI